MSLKKYLFSLLFPPYCRTCSSETASLKRYCIGCQKSLLYNFELQEQIEDPCFGRVEALFYPSLVIQDFISSNSYTLACFCILKLHRMSSCYPSCIYLQKVFPWKSGAREQKRLYPLQRSLSKLLGIPLYSFQELSKRKVGKLNILVIAFDRFGLKRYEKELKEFKENQNFELLTMVVVSWVYKVTKCNSLQMRKWIDWKEG